MHRYSVPYQINTSTIYPVPALNGSRIILCGHERGLLILWRGGRPLKPATRATEQTLKMNGASSDVLMVIDSDEEEQLPNPRETYHDRPEYEDEEEEFNPNEPYHPIVQQLDLPLGTAVLHMSIPNVPASIQSQELQSLPKLLHQHLVVALACADCTIRLLTLPLAPPSPSSKVRPELRTNPLLAFTGNGAWGEQIVTLNGNTTHQSLPKGVSIALSPRLIEESDKRLSEDTRDQDELSGNSTIALTSHLPNHNTLEDSKNQSRWDLIIASHSADLSGLLLIHKVPISAESLNLGIESTDSNCLWRTEFLAEPAITAQLHIPLQSTQGRYPCVLVAQSNGPVKLYDCCTASKADQGSWRLSLYASMYPSSNDSSNGRNLLDAKWVLGGKAVAVITSDGEWGIWDITSGSNMLGSSPTPFTVSGWIGSTPIGLQASKTSTARSDTRSRLAPMTPGTRKVKQEALFAGPIPGSNVSTLGGISVFPYSKVSNGPGNDEGIAMWHVDKIVVIPSFQTFWQNKVLGSGNLFSDGSSGRIREINSVPLLGEVKRSVAIFSSVKTTSDLGHTSSQPDILISGDRSFLVLASPLSKTETETSKSYDAKLPETVADQQLLAQGELDVLGMSRILDGLSNGHRVTDGATTNTMVKRKVGFAT